MRVHINQKFWIPVLCSILFAVPVQAALDAVSGRQVSEPPQLTEVLSSGDPTQVAVNLANGFPLWYRDVPDGLKLQLCLDTALDIAPGVVVNPCEYEPPALGAPPSFPGNFGAEAMYWNASTFGNYTSSDSTISSALLVLALEASGANEGALNDGNQAVFTRIRLRIDVPVAGTYRVTHPYGTFDYVVTVPGARAINQTQDLGLDVAQDFLLAMRDRGIDFITDPPPDFDPAEDDNGGVVNTDGATVGPFLVPAASWGGTFDANDPDTFVGGPITFDGVTYIGLPFAPNPTNPTVPIDIFQPVTGSAFIPVDEVEPANYFRIELLGAQGGFQLNPANTDNPQRVQFDNFLLVGKVFDDFANQAPVAVDDGAGTAVGSIANISVAANDVDVTAENADSNAYDINSQALALVDPARLDEPFYHTFASGMPRLTATQQTTAGGTVRRVTSVPTGTATFLYDPPDDFSDTDSFQYVIQDAGGLVSAPATVEITVEDLQVNRADYRARFGKWRLSGTSSDSLDNSITLLSGPRARLTPEQEVQALPVSSDVRGNASLRVSSNAIEFVLSVDPLPITAVTAAHIHVGAPGTNGPIIFSLFDIGFGLPFASPLGGNLSAANLQARSEAGITSFSDAVEAILGGNAYVNVHTAAFQAGEVRGQLGQQVIGRIDVTDGAWEFSGHSTASPGGLQSISVESGNGVRLLDVPLRLR